MKTKYIFLGAFFCLLFWACKDENKNQNGEWRTKKSAVANQKHNQLLNVEKEQGWALLFNGKTLEGWHLYNKPDSTHLSAWEVKNGMLYCNAMDEKRVFGDLVTDKSFKNYELVFEWQMGLRGNGGMFINVQEAPQFTTTYRTGLEYQLLEPTHMDTQTPKKQAGSLWGVSPQTNSITPYAVGQWNTGRIIQNNGTVEFYLNGILTAKETLGSTEWKQKLAYSNFKDNPDFGIATEGKIALQNWYFESWFRNMKIREL
ncbi:MAG: DUF1080 domain-containing protein [Croceivirga sp.]